MAILEIDPEPRQDTFGVSLDAFYSETFSTKPSFNDRVELNDNWSKIIEPGELISNVGCCFLSKEDPRSPEDNPHKKIQFEATFNLDRNVFLDADIQKIQSEFVALGIPLTFKESNQKKEDDEEEKDPDTTVNRKERTYLGTIESTPFELSFYKPYEDVKICFPKDTVTISTEEFSLLFQKYLNLVEKTICVIYKIKGLEVPARKLRLRPDIHYIKTHPFPQFELKEQKKKIMQCTSCSSQYCVDEGPECPNCGDSHPKSINSSKKRKK